MTMFDFNRLRKNIKSCIRQSLCNQMNDELKDNEEIKNVLKPSKRKYILRNRNIRNPQGNRPKKRVKLLNEDNLSKDYGKGCCSKRCLWHQVNFDDIISSRKENLLKTEKELTQWLVEKLKDKDNNGHYEIKKNEKCCKLAFVKYHGLSYHKMKEARRMINNGIMASNKVAMNEKDSPKYNWTRAWLSNYFNKECDKQVNGVWYLPQFIKSKDIQKEMMIDWPTYQTTTSPSLGLVRKVLRQEFKHVKRPCKGEWGLCSECELLRRSSNKKNISVEERTNIEQQKKKHRIIHQQERKNLEERIRDVKVDPRVALLLLYDQTRALKIPHFRPDNSTSRTASKVEIKIGGCINFSSDSKTIFVNLSNIPKSANLLVTEIHNQIIAALTSNHPSSSTLTLNCQCDGGSENINRTMFGYFGLLVKEKIFKEVCVNRLLVGHTHSQIGKVCLSIHLKII